MSSNKPTGKQLVLLYVAFFIRKGGRPSAEPDETMFGEKVFVMTPWRIEVKTQGFAAHKHNVQMLGSTFTRRWREVKEPPRDKLNAIGVTVEGRPPREDEDLYSGSNVVWDLRVDMDAFKEGVQEHSPWTDFVF